jgi:hypothetical protein
MPRKATSPAEFDQIGRVRTLLRGFRLFPAPELHVTTATQKVFSGHLVRDHVGNNARKGGRWTYYGSILLHTEHGEVEIDYLDIVSVDAKRPEGRGTAPSASGPACGSRDGSGMLPN